MARPTLRAYHPHDHAWLVDAHQQQYRMSDGFDDSFGALVSDILTDFETSHDPTCEAGWIATDGPAPVGSIFCVRSDETTAKLRLFLLLPHMRGTGLAQHMLDTCMDFARGASYRKITLWTHRSHQAAGRIYARTGFELVSESAVKSFGVALQEQIWTIAL